MARHWMLHLRICVVPVCLTVMQHAAWAADSGVIKWAGSVGNSLNQPESFYGSEEAIRIAETVLLHQRDNGGWGKNYDRARKLSDAEISRLKREKRRRDTTFDNGSTHSELRYLAKVHAATGDTRYQEAFLKGLAFTLKAQYESGGWPQFYPPPRSYHRHITFNDGAMIGVMTLLRDVAGDSKTYAFVDSRIRARAAEAVKRGLECILKCQIVVNGRKTAWCAQHDERTLAPAKARSYELASISGFESVGIVEHLMAIDGPSREVINAVKSAVAWFDSAKLTGIRVVQKRDPTAPNGVDRVVVKDPSAPPIWGRFYDINTNKPFFCSRDGVPRDTLAEISHERRNGYSWLGGYASRLLRKSYPAWQKKWAQGLNVIGGSGR